MNTSQIMNIALEMIDIKDIPGDSAIYNSGSGIKKVLMGIDMGVADTISNFYDVMCVL